MSGRERVLPPKGGHKGATRERVLPGSDKPKGEHGVGGFLHNLGSDTVSAVAGLPMGLVQTVEHPVRTAKAIGKQYAQTYGPLTHGDVGTFLSNVYAHPLGPITDALTVFTLGSGAAAKAGLLGAEGATARTLTLRSPAALVDKVAPTVDRLTSNNPAIRWRQTTIHNLKNKLPYETPVMGEAARYARAATREPRVAAMTLQKSSEMSAYNKATRNLSNEQLVAMHLIGNDLHPLDYAATLRKLQENGGTVEPTMFKVLENPKVVQAFEHPDAKLMHAVDAADALSQLDAAVKTGHGLLDPASAAARIGKHRVAAQEILGGDLRPTPSRPFYVPDVFDSRRVANSNLSRMGGGRGVPRVPGTSKSNHGVLFAMGQLVLNKDLLGPKFADTVKYALADDIHNTLMAGAARISKDEVRAGKVPKGWEFVPKEVVSKSGAKRPQQIGARARGQHDAIAQMEQMFPARERLANSFKVTDLSNAATLHGDYLIAPKTLIREAAGEFTRSTGGIRKIMRQPMTVWRALVLGFRVGFLTNNIVGTHFIAAIHAAGIDGLRAYLNAVKRVHGDPMVKSLLNMDGMPEPLRQQLMVDLFPDQVQGTFGRTQAPSLAGSPIQSQGVKRLARASSGLMPLTQAASEGIARRALVETYIRKSPEFRKVYRQMPKQTRDFELAARQVAAAPKGKAWQAHISEQVNNALGDYLNMGKFEEEVMRQAFPFYAWYRAITRITTHLALDTPGRANLLERIGQVGVDETQKKLGELPEWLFNLVPLGGDKVLATQGANPFNTITQLGQGAAGVLTGPPGSTGTAFSQLGPNPFMLAVIQNLAGKNLYTGKTMTGGLPGLPAQAVAEIWKALPQVQLGKAATGDGRVSKLYGKQTPLEALAQFLGVPVKQLDAATANSYAPPAVSGSRQRALPPS